MSRLSTPIEARLLTRAKAAAYCGYTPAGFANCMNKGILPGPIPGTARWDRKAIDAALDKISGISSHSAPADVFDRWKADYDASKAKGRGERYEVPR